MASSSGGSGSRSTSPSAVLNPLLRFCLEAAPKAPLDRARDRRCRFGGRKPGGDPGARGPAPSRAVRPPRLRSMEAGRIGRGEGGAPDLPESDREPQTGQNGRGKSGESKGVCAPSRSLMDHPGNLLSQILGWKTPVLRTVEGVRIQGGWRAAVRSRPPGGPGCRTAARPQDGERRSRTSDSDDTAPERLNT